MRSSLDRFATTFARANAHAIIHRKHKNLSVTDFTLRACTPPLGDRLDGWFDKSIVHRNFEANLSEKIHGKIMSSIGFGMTLLPAESLYIHKGETKDFNLGERGFHRFKTTWLDDGND